MKLEKNVAQSIRRNAYLSIFLYLVPILLMFGWFCLSGSKPWETYVPGELPSVFPGFVDAILANLTTWGLPVIMIIVGAIELGVGFYENKWTKNERILDIVCFILPRFMVRPAVAYFGLMVLPELLPHAKNAFEWIPFWWAFLILAVADDLTQYWYHRIHHQIPWLWRFHRTHHSAPYMGMAMAGRQNFLYTLFFSQIYLTTALTYFGLGYAALSVRAIKSLITTAAHSSIKWDRPFYEIKWLQPIGWVMERLISTPATHHAHHADTSDDGVGYYKGNFGNMFFIWDIVFGTALITRKYPKSYGIKQ